MTTDGTHNIVLVLSRARRHSDEVLVPRPPADPPEQLDRLGSVRARSAALFDGQHAPVRRPCAFPRDAEEERQGHLHEHRRRRTLDLADTARRVLHPRQAHELQRPVLRSRRVRNERALGDADRLAGRRLRRRARHERARDPPRPRLARLHPHAEPVDPEAGASHARRYALDDRLTVAQAVVRFRRLL